MIDWENTQVELIAMEQPPQEKRFVAYPPPPPPPPPTPLVQPVQNLQCINGGHLSSNVRVRDIKMA